MFPLSCFLSCDSKVEFFNTVTANDDNPCFLRVGGVYQHFVGHYFVSPRQPPAAACEAKPAAACLECGCRIIASAGRGLSAMAVPPAAIMARLICGPFHDCA